jgi:hypothetical protein
MIMDAEMNEEMCEECGRAEATTHPIVYEEWGPVPMCEECASHYDEDESEVMYMDAPPSDCDEDWDDDEEHYLLDADLLDDEDE